MKDTNTMVINTDKEGVILRQLTPPDAQFYFEAVMANRNHLSQFGDTTYEKYQSLEAVTESITNPANPNKLRLGIWDGEEFVGSINLTPDERSNYAEIGYWIDGRKTGNGYATLATVALTQHSIQDYEQIRANVVEGNEASANVLKRAGYRKIEGYGIGKMSFAFVAEH